MQLLKRYIIPLLLCLLCLHATSQERTHIDDHFSVVFPLTPEHGEKDNALIWQSNTDSAESPKGICVAAYIDAKTVGINPTELPKDPDLMKAFLKGLLKPLPGMKIIYQKSFKAHGVPGYFLQMVNEDQDRKVPYGSMFVKLFFKKNVLYMLSVSLVDPDGIDEGHNAFLNSFLFQ